MSGTTLTIDVDRGEYDRLVAVTDAPSELIRAATHDRIDLEAAIAFTRAGGFQGPDGFAKLMADQHPNWSLGTLMGINLRSMGEGTAEWVLDAGPNTQIPWGRSTEGSSATSVMRR